MASEQMMRRERLFMKRTPAFLERIDGAPLLASLNRGGTGQDGFAPHT